MTTPNREARRKAAKSTSKRKAGAKVDAPFVPPTEIAIAGKSWPVALPPFAERDDLVLAYHEAAKTGGGALTRACAAAIGLCTPVGRAAGADYERQHRCNVTTYGGAVYNWLRGHGADVGQIVQAAKPMVTMCANASFPREAEVAARADFSPPNGAAATG